MKLLFLFLAFITCLSACNVDRQAAKKVSWLLGHDKLAENCARIYPVRDSAAITDTIYIPSEQPDLTGKIDSILIGIGTISPDTIIYNDETVKKILQENIRLRAAINELKALYKPCPPQTIVEHTVYRENTAEVERLKSLLAAKDKVIQGKDELIAKKDLSIDKNRRWMIACFITWLVILLFWTFRLFIYKRPI